jgi:hypothetical protein
MLFLRAVTIISNDTNMSNNLDDFIEIDSYRDKDAKLRLIFNKDGSLSFQNINKNSFAPITIQQCVKFLGKLLESIGDDRSKNTQIIAKFFKLLSVVSTKINKYNKNTTKNQHITIYPALIQPMTRVLLIALKNKDDILGQMINDWNNAITLLIKNNSFIPMSNDITNPDCGPFFNLDTNFLSNHPSNVKIVCALRYFKDQSNNPYLQNLTTNAPQKTYYLTDFKKIDDEYLNQLKAPMLNLAQGLKNDPQIQNIPVIIKLDSISKIIKYYIKNGKNSDNILNKLLSFKLVKPFSNDHHETKIIIRMFLKTLYRADQKLKVSMISSMLKRYFQDEKVQIFDLISEANKKTYTHKFYLCRYQNSIRIKEIIYRDTNQLNTNYYNISEFSTLFEELKTSNKWSALNKTYISTILKEKPNKKKQSVIYIEDPSSLKDFLESNQFEKIQNNNNTSSKTATVAVVATIAAAAAVTGDGKRA